MLINSWNLLKLLTLGKIICFSVKSMLCLFSVYMCQSRKNLFSNVMTNQSVECLYLIDLEHQCLWTHFILKQSKNKSDYLLVACSVSCPLNSKWCIPTLSLELIYFGVLSRWGGYLDIVCRPSGEPQSVKISHRAPLGPGAGQDPFFGQEDVRWNLINWNIKSISVSP